MIFIGLSWFLRAIKQMRVSVLPENWWSEIGELGKLEKSPLISSSKIEKWPLVMVKSNKTRML